MNDEKLINTIGEYIYTTIGKIDNALKKFDEYHEQMQAINESLDLYNDYKAGKVDLIDIFKTQDKVDSFKQLPVHVKRNITLMLGQMEYEEAQFSSSVADVREYAFRMKDFDFKYKDKFKDLKQNLEQELKAYETEKISTKVMMNLIIDKISGDHKAEKFNTEIQQLLK